VKFNNAIMLAGLVAVLVPIIIHLLNRSRAKVLDWGAMRFLLASLTSQNRRILVEEMILLALRCLLVAFVVLAMAQPFLPTRARIPWAIALPCFLGAVIALGVAAAMWSYRRARWALLGLAVALGAIAAGASAVEQWWQEIKWAAGRGERDIAIVLDASTSMTLNVGGKTNFQRAVAEARLLVDACKPGDAVSLFLAGPVPRPVVATPTADRQQLAAALQGLAPVGGTMGVLEAINAAAQSLAEGHNTNKKIVLITDGQNVGWDVRSEARWRFLAESLKALPTEPKIICRKLSLPRSFRNAALAGITFSRKVVGTDRPVRIDVKVMNTGTAPIKPKAVQLLVDGAKVATEKLPTQILPKAAETVRFEHRFEQAGPRLVSARIVLHDDLPADNAADRVLGVVDRLPVLLVDGVPSPAPLGSASAFIEIALTPRGTPEEDEAAAPDLSDELPPAEAEARAAARARQADLRFLVEPRVVPAPDIASVEGFHDYAVVILANVPALPAAVARDLAAFVQRGGGLLIAPGSRAKPTFYNAWATASTEPVLPADLAERREAHDAPVRLEPLSFTHPALRLLADTKASDIGLALIKSYWKLAPDERDPAVRVAGRLSTGEPFLVERKLGKGRVLLFACPLDPAGGNLPALKSFVPMLHEAVSYVAAPMMPDANVAPGSEVVLELRPRSGTAAGTGGGTGLLGEYYRGTNFQLPRATRVDAAVDFDWKDDRPAPAVGRDGFSVRWTGWVVPGKSGTHTFYVVADDGVRLWVDGKQLVDAWRGQNPTEYSAALTLEAGRRYPIKMEYFEDTGNAVARLLWTPPGGTKQVIPRSHLFPAAAGGSSAPASGQQVAQVTTPSQRHCPARLERAGAMLRVSFADTQEPGLYVLTLPPALAELYTPPGAEGKGIPFVALSSVDESLLEPLTAADMELPRQSIDLFETELSDEVAAQTFGGVPGQDLWKYFIIGALLALLGETAVARWIAIQRRLGATPTVVFGSEVVDVQTFRDRAKRLLAVPGRTAEPAAKP